MLVGVLATIATFTFLSYAFVGLFTGGGILVAWGLAWTAGMIAAGPMRFPVLWKKELTTALIIIGVVIGLNVAFFRNWLWWSVWTP